jgi:hypothetical protein
MDDLDRLYHRLLDAVRENAPHLRERGFRLGDIPQHLLPYRLHRRELGFESVQQYERALARLGGGRARLRERGRGRARGLPPARPPTRRRRLDQLLRHLRRLAVALAPDSRHRPTTRGRRRARRVGRAPSPAADPARPADDARRGACPTPAARAARDVAQPHHGRDRRPRPVATAVRGAEPPALPCASCPRGAARPPRGGGGSARRAAPARAPDAGPCATGSTARRRAPPNPRAPRCLPVRAPAPSWAAPARTAGGRSPADRGVTFCPLLRREPDRAPVPGVQHRARGGVAVLHHLRARGRRPAAAAAGG